VSHDRPPAIVIVIALEEPPAVRIWHAPHEGDEHRIRYWLDSRPELRDLVDRALELADEKRVA
jgi:hypothetical protein